MSLTAGLLFFLLSLTALAGEMVEDFQSTRALGMGGVYIYGDSDAGVIFHNPAGLAKLEGINWSVFDLAFGAGGGGSILQTADDFQNLGAVSGIGSLAPIYGKNVGAGGSGYSAFGIPYLGFGVFQSLSAALRLDNPSFPNMNAKYHSDYGYKIGGAIPIGPVSVGIGIKRVSRLGGDKNIGGDLLANADSTTLAEQFKDEGIGYGLDAGLIFAPPTLFNPTLSFSWQDVGSTAFTHTHGSGAPDRIQDNLTAGLTVSGEVPMLGFAAGLEYRHINLPTEPLPKKIHFGAEISIAMFDLRAGFYQGYTTYGAGVDLLFLQLDAALYSVEKGAYAGQTPDQRVQVSLSMNLGFDPNFNLTDIGGKRRKLKQRR